MIVDVALDNPLAFTRPVLSLFLLCGGLFLATGAAAGRNIARRSER